MDVRHIEYELREAHRIHVRYREVRQLRGLRVSPHVYTTLRDLECFVDALEQVAAGART